MTRKLRICFSLILLCCATVLFAQDSDALLQAYLRNFEKGGPDAKLRLIQDAAALDNPGLAPLFKRAVEFTVSTSERGKNVSLIRQFSVISTEQCERYKFEDARTVVWKLFLMDVDSNVRMKTLKALAVIAQGDKLIVKSLNEWLAGQVEAYKPGKDPRLPILIRWK